MATRSLPIWYDPVCITTSVVYAVAAYQVFEETQDSQWLVVVASGIVSAVFRTFRCHKTVSNTCMKDWGFLCSSRGACLFAVDLFLAVLSILLLSKRVHVTYSVPIVGILVCAWILYSIKLDNTSCLVHSLGHVSVCGVLIKGVTMM